MRCLLQLYKSRLATLLPLREALLRDQAACAADGEATAEVLASLTRLQSEYVYTALAFANALYTSVLSPEQVRVTGK